MRYIVSCKSLNQGQNSVITDMKHTETHIYFLREYAVQFTTGELHCGNLYKEESVRKNVTVNLEYGFSVISSFEIRHV